MKKQIKKSYFKRNALGFIRKSFNPVDVGLSEIIEGLKSLNTNQYLLIKEDLLPERFKEIQSSGKKFLNLEIANIEKIVNYKKNLLELRRKAFDNVIAFTKYTGYSYTSNNFLVPNIEISLVDCLEGAKIYTYSNRDLKGCCKPEINLKPYSDYSEMAGATFIISTPSRTKNKGKYNFKYDNVPISDNEMKHRLSIIANTNHSCEEKNYDIRKSLKNKSNLRYLKHCPHEIASYLQIIDYCKDELKTVIPLEMSIFAIPTQLASNIYTLSLEKTLINDQGSYRLLNKSELERILWLMVQKEGHDKTFYATKKLRNYNWDFEKIIFTTN